MIYCHDMIVQNTEFYLVVDGSRLRYAIERAENGGSIVRCIEPERSNAPQRYFDAKLDSRDVSMVSEVMKRFI